MANYYGSLRISPMSASNLERVNRTGNKMEVYTRVAICCTNGCKHTQVDRVGDTNPTWNDTMTFSVKMKECALWFELICYEPNRPYYHIGQVFVKVTDLIGPFEGSRIYPVLTRSGNSKGTLTFRYRWVPPSPPPPPRTVTSRYKNLRRTVAAGAVRGVGSAVGHAVGVEAIHVVTHMIQGLFRGS